jgi:hypothetical protein
VNISVLKLAEVPYNNLAIANSKKINVLTFAADETN